MQCNYSWLCLYQTSINTTRNRVYDAISKFSDANHLLVLCRKLLTEANRIDKQIIVEDPTHLLFLQYLTKRGMGFHSDNGANDGAKLNPVVSISLGNYCVFSIKHPKTIIGKIKLHT